MTHSESLGKLLPALVAAQAEFPAIPRDGYNPHFKSRFSTLKAVQTATRPVLAKHDLVVTQFPSVVDGKPALTTWLAHTSGEFINESTLLCLAKSDPQSQGGALTYLRRYAWSAILGLVTDEDDDDGNAATIAPRATPAADKSGSEFRRVIDAAKRAGVTKEQAEEAFQKRFGATLSANAAAESLASYADALTVQATQKELAL